ncbi:unnamed protein product [Rotaria magnacalcarata]|uniref:Uncharacterized protein n=1 Tax=Rotaria magnacalcarata TaxID=392030 RepID=A0A816MY47_9BILA|nr:unnamed protein product [Rotaria magnacalcarata]
MMNDNVQFNRNDGVMQFNAQEYNDPLPFNVAPHFSPNTTLTLSSQLLSELIDFHKKRLLSYAVPNCYGYFQICERYNESLYIAGLILAGTFAFIALLVACIWSCQMCIQLSDFNDPRILENAIVWRLDGEEWIRYLNYIHGPDRQWRAAAPLSSFCCRRASYEQLMNHQYGHIILYENGFIIDELYFISFRLYTLLGIESPNFGLHSPILGLRFHTLLRAGKNSRNIYFDLFAPSSISREQLRGIAQSYHRNAYGLSFF